MVRRLLFLGLVGIGSLALIGCGPDKKQPPVDEHDPIAFGKQVFTVNCALCHQTTGLGLPDQFPPLGGSEIVLGQNGFTKTHLIRLVLDGLADPVTVHGGIYNGLMPSWKETLTDAQIAAVLTYIRQAWGNQAGPITKEEVAALRAESDRGHAPWTVEELKQSPPAPLPSKKPES